MDRLTVAQAAERLGVTQDAVRQRVRRGTIEHERTDDGRVYVYLTEDDAQPDTVQKALVEELRDRVRSLEEQLARRDAIMMRLTESLGQLGQLEAPRQPRESPESAEEAAVSTPPPEEQQEQQEPTSQAQASKRQVPWWRRWLG
jgi:excisionase family DNA binding protein